MRTKCLGHLVAILILVLAGAAMAGKPSPGFERMIEGMSGGDLVTALVVLEDQPDIEALDVELRAGKAKLNVRHRRVVEALQAAANRSQGAVQAAIEADKSKGGIVDYKKYWIINAFLVRGTVSAVLELAERPDVRVVEPNLIGELIEPLPSDQTALKDETILAGVTPGLEAINVPQVWAEFGITGSGTIVGNLDTGVDVTHEAYGDRWRGHFAPPAECWADVAQVGSSVPFDSDDHGSHVMGTLTGASADMAFGVAPGALWIATNGIIYNPDLEVTQTILDSYQFFADPDGNPATTADVPDVVQNSWGVNGNFTGFFDCDTSWNTAIANCEAAGVAMIFSAGNEGPLGGSLRSPANIADSPTASFSVGATETAAPFLIADFSSRGPSDCGGPYAMKPEVSAPGVNIYSALPGGLYGFKSGTSMSGPHVAGVVALMRDADPNVDVTTMKEILMWTARDRGFVGEDFSYGHGVIDAYAAVAAVMVNIGHVVGGIADSTTGAPIPGAVVTTDVSGVVAQTNENGDFHMSLAPGEHLLHVTGFGHTGASFQVTVVAGTGAVVDWQLASVPTSNLSGVVLDEAGSPVAGAAVTVLGTSLPAQSTSGAGGYSFDLPTGATYDVEVDAGALGHAVRSISLPGNVTYDFHLGLRQYEDFETGNFLRWPWNPFNWEIVSSGAYEGAYRARTVSLANEEVANLTATVDVVSGGDITFRYYTTSSHPEDFMWFYVTRADGTNSNHLVPAPSDWTEISVPLEAGEQTLHWIFFKFGSATEDDIRGSLDLIEFPEIVIPPHPELALSDEYFHIDVDLGGSAHESLILFNDGNADLDWSGVVTTTPSKVMPASTEQVLRILMKETVDPVFRNKLDKVLNGAATEKRPPTGPSVTINPTSGIIAPDGQQSMSISVNASGVNQGSYGTSIVLSTNDPYQTQVIVPVFINVGFTYPSAKAVGGGSLSTAPNPFNPATVLNFSTARTRNVTLNIYDLGGRLIQTITAGPLPAGDHSYTWRGDDRAGRQVASGTYFVRLKIDQETVVKSVVLLR